ncbi:MAG TPA: hypothetical protein PLR25_16430, partial [Planctomycetaceae bacterium]|nr:hypothetical protein [Planctomycetaceae bacterium]
FTMFAEDVELIPKGSFAELLDLVEHHKLGAHYTPRAYVERLVIPTIMEPLSNEWDTASSAVRSRVGALEREFTASFRATWSIDKKFSPFCLSFSARRVHFATP